MQEVTKETVVKWIEALRSGEYVQGTGYLQKGGLFCCLGVLHEVASGRWTYDLDSQAMVPEESVDSHERMLGIWDLGTYGVNEVRVRETLGDQNDLHLRKFPEIADWIESTYHEWSIFKGTEDSNRLESEHA